MEEKKKRGRKASTYPMKKFFRHIRSHWEVPLREVFDKEKKRLRAIDDKNDKKLKPK